jgi:hypothetical protein
MQADCGTRILRVISRAGRPCHFPNWLRSRRAVGLTMLANGG